MNTIFYFVFFVGLVFISFYLPAQNPTEQSFKLFLIGDAGDNDTTGATLRDLKLKLENTPNSSVIFLGDNCYKKTLGIEVKGFDGSKITRKRAMAQLNILKNYKGSAYFIPGNHEWWNVISIKKGKKHVLKEEIFIEDSLKTFTNLSNHNTGTFFPKSGDAGPVLRELNRGKIAVIFIDTYRLILEEIKHKKQNIEYINSFYNNFENQLKNAANKNQKIIVAAHHPIYSKGKHSQSVKFSHRYIRRFANSNSNYRPNKNIANRIDSLLKVHNKSGIYYVCGHEHSLQYFYANSIHYILSGSGSKINKVDYESVENKNEVLKWNEEGFFEIDFYNNLEKIFMYHRKDIKSVLRCTCIGNCDH